jgi:hypothetical protein
LRKHGCFKLSVKMLLRQPCTLMEEEEEEEEEFDFDFE